MSIPVAPRESVGADVGGEGEQIDGKTKEKRIKGRGGNFTELPAGGFSANFEEHTSETKHKVQGRTEPHEKKNEIKKVFIRRSSDPNK